LKSRRGERSSDEDSSEDDEGTDDDPDVSDTNVSDILQALENDDIDETG
jgi:hypothetical protein